MRIAVTREVSRSIGRCELSFQSRVPIDWELARVQHQLYENCLLSLGCRLVRLAEAPELPDSVFVEDMAIVLDELALISRPGAPVRRPETAAVAKALRPYRNVIFIEEPGTLDGGDVLRIGRNIYVGISHRTNAAAIRQLRDAIHPYGYAVSCIPIENCLHLKSAVTQVAEDTLLINRQWIDADAFGPMRLIDVDPSEPGAANALLIDGTVIFPSAYSNTQLRLANFGVRLLTVEVSELAKAEGGVTCCSLIFPDEH